MPFGVAVIGLDHWYTAFAAIDTLSASTVAPLIGISDPDSDRQAKMREKYPNVSVVGSADELIDRSDVDLVAICASTDQAPALARRALAAGKHVVSVKPAARTLAELDTVLAAAARAGKFVGSFEGMQRLHPRAIIARDLIRSGAIGLPLSFQQRGHGGLPSPWPGQGGDPATGGDSWWLHADRAPGGAWIDHGIYAIDLARFVFGESAPLEVVGSLIDKRLQPHLEMEDYGVALLRLHPDAALATTPVSLVIEDTWAAKAGGGAHRQEFLGSEGIMRQDGNEWVVKRGSEETRHAVPASPFFVFDTLVQMLERGEAPPFGPADARANLAACLGVYESAA